MKIFFGLFLVTLSLSSMANEIEAPFGFVWGQSYQQISSKVLLTDCSTRKHLMMCETTQPIKKVSYGERYIVVIDHKHGLQKVILVSRNITSDKLGAEGKALYSQIKKSLTKKYYPPQVTDYSASDNDSDSAFYQCLKTNDCGSWLSHWNGKDGSQAMVELKGLSDGKGYLMMTYQSNKWEQIIKFVNVEKKKSDFDAL